MSQIAKGFGFVACVGAIGFTSTVVQASPSNQQVMVTAQSATMKNPQTDASAWSNTYGEMVHSGSGQNELDFSVPVVQSSSFGEIDDEYVATQLSVLPFGNFPKGSNFCDQLIFNNVQTGAIQSTSFECLPTATYGYTQEVIGPGYLPFMQMAQVFNQSYDPTFGPETTILFATWVTGNGTLFGLRYEWDS